MDDPVVKKLSGEGHRVIVFTILPSGMYEYPSPGVFVYHLGQQTKEAPYGSTFEDFMSWNPVDLLLLGEDVPDNGKSRFHNKVKLVMHDTELDSVKKMFEIMTSNKPDLYRYLVYSSDYYLAKIVNDKYNLGYDDDHYYLNVEKDWWNTEEDHDKWGMNLIEHGERHSMGRYKEQEDILTRLRFLNILDSLPNKSFVLDYGCQIGQITLYLAQKYPNLNFIGADISGKQIDHGNKLLKEKFPTIKNIELIQCSRPSEIIQQIDCVICMEVVEHLWDYKSFLVELESVCVEGGKMLVTTPYGFYEGLSFFKFGEGERQHLHNFEEDDIVELMGGKDEFFLSYVTNELSSLEDKNGHYGWLWTKNSSKGFGSIDYQRKALEQNPYLSHDDYTDKFMSNLG